MNWGPRGRRKARRSSIACRTALAVQEVGSRAAGGLQPVQQKPGCVFGGDILYCAFGKVLVINVDGTDAASVATGLRHTVSVSGSGYRHRSRSFRKRLPLWIPPEKWPIAGHRNERTRQDKRAESPWRFSQYYGEKMTPGSGVAFPVEECTGIGEGCDCTASRISNRENIDGVAMAAPSRFTRHPCGPSSAETEPRMRFREVLVINLDDRDSAKMAATLGHDNLVRIVPLVGPHHGVRDGHGGFLSGSDGPLTLTTGMGTAPPSRRGRASSIASRISSRCGRIGDHSESRFQPAREVRGRAPSARNVSMPFLGKDWWMDEEGMDTACVAAILGHDDPFRVGTHRLGPITAPGTRGGRGDEPAHPTTP